MLLTKTIDIKLNGKNVNRLKELGYDIPQHWNEHHKQYSANLGELIKININDLSVGSHAKVEVCCDYCGKVIIKSYRDYLKNHDNDLGDCCKQCEYVKCQKTIKEKYGVEKVVDIPNYFEKIKDNNKKKYGVEWAAKLPETTEKRKRTNLQKYGVEHVLQNPDICAKVSETKCKNLTNPTSKPQRKLAKLLEELYGSCDLEVPCGKCSLDCVVNVNSISLDVEYDGWFYHQDAQRDRRRDCFVRCQGYKILRVKGNKKDILPSIDVVKEHIHKLVTSNIQYTEIVM